ncbi:MAG: hypothetical protein HOD00_07065 [Gemmatimonadales bacterium]|jgi:hypothetical protein|nr:hypothetical protein [Gemmatimonadales bacterium]MDG2239290.1 hypothetical protein [Longimicrobiales bacterium]NCG33805.1 hypothetical protein [Pseudomonadota bacterium]MBT3773061.1 hypothetical protein [Gemmatimonadales bacterium]MBT3959146.1 hypothetical protein [Gemmatimonadales bacterium]|tara:strand:- start:508 stop:657 length:150 start_codon:yes stop_codon:yes gene_type:complete
MTFVLIALGVLTGAIALVRAVTMKKVSVEDLVEAAQSAAAPTLRTRSAP